MTLISSLFELIQSNDSFCISSHMSQDADSVGSQLAMYWYLESLGKKVTMYNCDPLPEKFRFLENSDKLSAVAPTEKFDVLVVLDSSNLSRIGWDEGAGLATKIIDIDHHRDNSRFGDVSIVVETAAATCQIIYEIFRDEGIEFPLHVAESLYAGIIADTGGFQFENTSSEVLRDSAELVDMGVRNAYVYRKLFHSRSTNGMLLRAKIWSTLEYFAEGKIGVMVLDDSLLEELGADRGDTEGMSDIAMTGLGVEVGMLIKECGGDVHFSLRSVGNVDVGRIAASIPGGGGHGCAAGCTMKSISLVDARTHILDKVSAVL